MFHALVVSGRHCFGLLLLPRLDQPVLDHSYKTALEQALMVIVKMEKYYSEILYIHLEYI